MERERERGEKNRLTGISRREKRERESCMSHATNASSPNTILFMLESFFLPSYETSFSGSI